MGEDSVLTCPKCGRQNDGYSPLDSKDKNPPVEGDVSVCAYCSHVSTLKKGKYVTATNKFIANLPEKNRKELAWAQTVLLMSNSKVK